ncbi:MAG TPA: hypothetical protein VME23_19395 [Terracidiphilus sp.]|nr:hypothetical protein [Terracidiphilus sp.]
MTTWLTAASFATYPPQGRELAVSHIEALRQIPVALLPVFLVDLKAFDWKFPVEQREITKRIEFAGANPSSLTGFSDIHVTSALDNPERMKDPQRFLADMTSYLWSSLQMDAYRKAADRFVDLYSAAAEPVLPAMPRLVMICVGRDAQPGSWQLFQKLRRFGQVRTNVRSDGAAGAMLTALRERAQSHPAPYAHWYVDGGSPLPGLPSDGVTKILYPELAPLDAQILARMKACIQAGTGPEVLHVQLAELNQLAPSGNASLPDPCLQNFAVSLLTEGSGTQIFSTSFVQWTTREVLRRAQPATVLARFAPRQRQRSFNDMVAAASNGTDLDPDGSLIDADMAAFYAYLEMMRLQGADKSAFLVWFEGHSQAFVASRNTPPGTESDTPATIDELLAAA